MITLGDTYLRLFMDLLNKIFEHLAGRVEIRYDTVFHRPDGHNICGGLPEHSLCVGAYRYYLFIVLLHYDDGRLIADNAFPFNVDEGVGSAEVYCKVIRKHPEYTMKKHVTSSNDYKSFNHGSLCHLIPETHAAFTPEEQNEFNHVDNQTVAPA